MTATRDRIIAAADANGWTSQTSTLTDSVEYRRGDVRVLVHYSRAGRINEVSRRVVGELAELITSGRGKGDTVVTWLERNDPIAVLGTEVTEEIQADARANHAARRHGAPALSRVVMGQLEGPKALGLKVGSLYARTVLRAYADAYDAAVNAEVARVLPELAGTPACPAPTLPESATVRTWNLHMVNEGTSTPAGTRIAYQVRDRDTGDVLGTVRQENAHHGLYGATDATGALRVSGEMSRLDAARRLVDLIAEDDDRDGTTYDPETDGGHFLADPAGGGTWQPGPVPGSFHDPRVACCDRDAADCDCSPIAVAVATNGTVWLCGTCLEDVTEDLAQCEDGCSRHLDHVGPCHLREHDRDDCDRCGTVDRLTSYDVENLDEEQTATLMAVPDRCERCAATFAPDEAGTSPDAGLCAHCTAYNDARVTL